MMSSIESAPTLNAGLVPSYSRYARWLPVPRKFGAYAAAVIGKLRDLAPYAVIELVLPGGSLMALLLWIYRRQKKVSVQTSRLSPGSLASTDEETRVPDPCAAGWESLGGSLPLQFVDVRKELRIGSKCRQCFEQQRKLAAFAKDVRRKVLDRPIPRK
jgi:hypothetical protein